MKQFTEVRVCNYCSGFVHEHHLGDEGWSICEDCGATEAGDKTKYECPDCLSICDEEKCNCNDTNSTGALE